MNDLDSDILCRGHGYILDFKFFFRVKSIYLYMTLLLVLQLNAKKYTLLCDAYDHAARGDSTAPFNSTPGSLRGIGGITPSSSE